MLHRYGFALAYLACFVAVELTYTLLDPDAQSRLIAWASTNVANLEHRRPGRCWSRPSSRPGTSGPGQC